MRNELKAVITKLKIIQKKVEGYLNAADYSQGNEERVEKLETEFDAITEAIETLEEIE